VVSSNEGFSVIEAVKDLDLAQTVAAL
jgi:hypothetical protein